MRILYIITGLRHGGAEKLLYLTCKYLGRMPEILVDVIYFDPYAPMLPLFTQLDIKPHLIKHNIMLIPRLMQSIHKGKYTIIHTHLIHADIEGRLAAFLASSPKKTAIFTTAHGTEWFRWRPDLYCKTVRLVDRWLSRPQRSHVIAISQSVREVLIKNQRISQDKIHLLYNAIELLAPALVQKKNLNNSILRLLFVGRLSAEKNIPCLLRALYLVRDLPISLTVVGEGKMKNILQNMIVSLNLKSRVELPGATLDTHEYYDNHDVLILPSSSEGLGIVILEAFNHGMPVIGSDVDGIKELLNDGRGLLFANDDHEQLAEKIKLLYHDRELRTRLGQYGLTYVRKNHDVQEYVIKLVSLYQDAVGSLLKI